MTTNALIHITGNQTMDGESFDTDFVTEGSFSLLPDGCEISYEETELTGMTNTTSRLTVQGEEVVLTRSGDNCARMQFKNGQRYCGHYDTPYGAFTICILPHQVEVDLTPAGGRIYLHYRMELEHMMTSSNTLELVITAQ